MKRLKFSEQKIALILWLFFCVSVARWAGELPSAAIQEISVPIGR